MTYGEKIDVVVQDRNSRSQMATFAPERLVPVIIAAFIGDLRERRGGAIPSATEDRERSARAAIAEEAAMQVFGNQVSAKRWLLTPSSATGWRIPASLAALSADGLNLVRALLSDPSLRIETKLANRLELVVAALPPDKTGKIDPSDVEVVQTVDLMGDAVAGRAAWLLSLPNGKYDVVIEGLGWPFDPELVLSSRIAEYQEAIQVTEAFIADAHRVGAFKAPPVADAEI